VIRTPQHSLNISANSTCDCKVYKVNMLTPTVFCFCVAVYRETALLYALSAAALTHIVAQACADGSMRRCRCTEAQNSEDTRHIWPWGLCGDNYSYGQRFTRRFMQLRQSRVDHQLRFLVRHNINVGIQVRERLSFLLVQCSYVEETESGPEASSVHILVLSNCRTLRSNT
jgi:hypothetical protein